MQLLHDSIDETALVAAQHMPKYGSQETKHAALITSPAHTERTNDMASLTHSRLQSNVLARMGHMIEEQRARFARYRVYTNTLNELRTLSGRELDDLGLHRSMLKRVAFEAAYGK